MNGNVSEQNASDRVTFGEKNLDRTYCSSYYKTKVGESVKKEKTMLEQSVNKIPLNLHVLFEENEKLVTAHCLDFDIVTQGENREEAEDMLKDAVLEHVLFALENNLIHKLYDPAPPEFWEKYYLQRFKDQSARRIRETHSLLMEIEPAYV